MSFVPLSAVFAVVGAVVGVLADRFSTRWPEHEPPEFPAGRAVGWRTVVCGLFGAFALAVLPARFGGDALALALFGAWFVTLIVGLATDLDQRLLPDLLTLPVIPVAAIYAVSGQNPLVGGDLLPAVAVAIVVPGVIYLASIPFGVGAFGIGDVKLLVGVGLMSGGDPGDHRARVGAVPRRPRAGRAGRDPADHAPELRAVRAVPDLRGGLGDRRPRLRHRRRISGAPGAGETWCGAVWSGVVAGPKYGSSAMVCNAYGRHPPV